MDDKKMLELAARAAGIEITGWDNKGNPCICWAEYQPWNPLHDDGDALRLAVKLGLNVMQGMARDEDGRLSVESGADPYADTRRAIVRAAAAIGEQM